MKNKIPAGIGLVAVGFVLGYFAGRYSLRLPGSTVPGAQSSHQGTELGPWTGSFKIPGSFHMPENSPFIRCDFGESPTAWGQMHVTITNLTGRSYLIRFSIYGYDSSARRISDAHDEFAIGGHESIVRGLTLWSQVFGLHHNPFGQTFRAEITLEE
jgi:hypothetical protein